MIKNLKQQFEEKFGDPPKWLIRAPGRVNLIGDHTDYNDGFVLPMAIDRATYLAASPASGLTSIRAYSLDLQYSETFSTTRNDLKITGQWTDYIKGVFAEFLEQGFQSTGFDLMVSSNVPIGCGLSSSAALQIAMAKLLQTMQPGVVEDNQIAQLCQTAEHRFTGTPVGIMDQFVIAHAKHDHLLFLDCRSLEAKHIFFDDKDVEVLIVDSNVERQLRDGDYAQRRKQCSEACQILGVSHLRDLTPDDVEQAKGKIGDLRYRRAKHVTTENRRTSKMIEALQNRDWYECGRLMIASHHSMRLDFENSRDQVDLLVSLAQEMGSENGVYGARMTGGGFGGCVVMLVTKNSSAKVVSKLSDGYLNKTGLRLRAYVSTPQCGAQVI